MRVEWRAMGSWCSFTLPAGEAGLARQLIDRLTELEARWTRFRPTSEISRLRPGWNALSEETSSLLDRCDRAWRMTGGAFDPTLGAAMKAAGYGGTDPTEGSHCGRWAEVEFRRHRRELWLPEGVTVDVGAIAKGFTADLLAAEALEAGAAWSIVDIGGDVRVAGLRREPFAIGIELDGPYGRCLTLHIGNGAVATSGTMRRAWGPADERRHHVMDPGTGRSAMTDLASVAVWAEEAWEAEVLATAAVVGGIETVRWAPSALGLTIDGALVGHGLLAAAA